MEYKGSISFSAVTVLDLAANRLTKLPPGFGTALVNLRALRLGGPAPGDGSYGCRNRLTCLPASVVAALAPTLEELSLHDNELQGLPTLDACRQLKQLRLDRNHLTREAEASYGRVVALKHRLHRVTERLARVDDAVANANEEELAQICATNQPQEFKVAGDETSNLFTPHTRPAALQA